MDTFRRKFSRATNVFARSGVQWFLVLFAHVRHVHFGRFASDSISTESGEADYCDENNQ
jgi:hypothetical protein